MVQGARLKTLASLFVLNMYLEDYTKEDLIKAYKATLLDNQSLQNQLNKAKKEIKELNSKFKNFEVDRLYREPNQKRFSIR
jgi:hypothetical protein